ncbi:unnamed protein product [Mytilus coruscus]|uniref:C2H2-type domain-containing protein n=1 Tax=Mytilus coruscus TaxID=42192 RepID=A0A6J8C9Z9_MYTCO|nr:unnamed protein product [Mytilus coruscus]
MSDYICNWDNCKFEGTKNLAIRHVIITHAPPEKVPYFCTLCSFRATNLKAFERHLTTFRQHILLEKENSQTNEYLQSYNVTWGNRNCDLTLKNEKYLYPEPNIVPVLLEINEDYTVYNETIIESTASQTEENNENIEKLKTKHKREMNNLAEYIIRLE